MESRNTISPHALTSPTPQPFKTLLKFDTRTLMHIHGYLFSQIETISQLGWLYGQTMTDEQIAKFPSISVGSFRELTRNYVHLCRDAWASTSQEDRHHSLAHRCNDVFNAIMRPQSVNASFMTPQENDKALLLNKRLQDYPENDRKDFYNFVLKPIYVKNFPINRMNFVMRELRSLIQVDQEMFLYEFFDCHTTENIKDYIIHLLIPCIRTDEVMQNIVVLLNNWSLDIAHLTARKIYLKEIIKAMYERNKRSQLLNLAVGMHAILSASSDLSLNEDPDFQIEPFDSRPKYDSDLSVEIFLHFLLPLFKSEWRTRAVLAKLSPHKIDQAAGLAEIKEALAQIARKPESKESIQNSLTFTLRSLTATT